jgi:hypothetical protein
MMYTHSLAFQPSSQSAQTQITPPPSGGSMILPPFSQFLNQVAMYKDDSFNQFQSRLAGRFYVQNYRFYPLFFRQQVQSMSLNDPASYHRSNPAIQTAGLIGSNFPKTSEIKVNLQPPEGSNPKKHKRIDEDCNQQEMKAPEEKRRKKKHHNLKEVPDELLNDWKLPSSRAHLPPSAYLKRETISVKHYLEGINNLCLKKKFKDAYYSFKLALVSCEPSENEIKTTSEAAINFIKQVCTMPLVKEFLVSHKAEDHHTLCYLILEIMTSKEDDFITFAATTLEKSLTFLLSLLKKNFRESFEQDLVVFKKLLNEVKAHLPHFVSLKEEELKTLTSLRVNFPLPQR